MISAQSNLKQLLNRAWEEVQADPQLELSPWMKLCIYDALLAPELQLLRKVHETFADVIPQRIHLMPNMQKVFYLGMLTVDKVFPIWDRDSHAYGEVEEWGKGWDHFIYTIHQVNIELLKNHLLDVYEIPILKDGNDSFGYVNDWWGCLGNITNEVIFTQDEALWAVYSIHALLSRQTIYKFSPYEPLTKTIRDSKLNNYNFDFTVHTFRACSFHDPTVPKYVYRENTQEKLIPEKGLAFWKWWLFEAVPTAYEIDINSINWDVFRKDKYLHLFDESFLSS